MTEADIKTRTLARWIRKRLEGKVSPDILDSLTDEELVEKYEEKDQRKLELLRAKHAPPTNESQPRAVLIFLDLDGVLRRKQSPLYRLDADCLSAFEQAVRKLPDAEIVITSTWREAFSLERMRGLFSPDIAARIVGVTPIDRRREGHYRYREVLAYMRRNGKSGVSWVALDDDSSHYPPFANLILIDAERGFDSHAAERLANTVQYAS